MGAVRIILLFPEGVPVALRKKEDFCYFLKNQIMSPQLELLHKVAAMQDAETKKRIRGLIDDLGLAFLNVRPVEPEPTAAMV